MADGTGPLRFTPLELLLLLGNGRETFSSNILEKLLSRGAKCRGADDLLCAVHGGNLEFVEKTFDAVKQNLNPRDFQWIRYRIPGHTILYQKPLFSYLIETCGTSSDRHPGPRLAALLQDFVACGYDVNAVADGEDHQLFAVLDFAVDFDGDRVLLKAFLEHGRPVVNVKNEVGDNPIEFVLGAVGQRSGKSESNPVVLENCAEIVRLLLRHEVDVSSMEIGAKTNFVFDGDLLKLLCAAGARVNQDLSECRLSHDPGSSASRKRAKVAEGVKSATWFLTPEEKKLNLKMLCRTVIKNSLRTIDDLEQLSLPTAVKEFMRE